MEEVQIISKLSKCKGSENKKSLLKTKMSGKIDPNGSAIRRNHEISEFKGTKTDRISERKQMLSKINSKNMNDVNFATLIEDLIRLEESFIL